MIKLSKTWSYALKAVLYIAWKSPEVLKIKDISINQGISESLLRRIIADLERWWIIKTIKWRNGWVLLIKEFTDVSIYDILKSSGEELWIRSCTKWISCENIDNCNTTIILWNLQKGFNSILELYTLDKIIKKDF